MNSNLISFFTSAPLRRKRSPDERSEIRVGRSRISLRFMRGTKGAAA